MVTRVQKSVNDAVIYGALVIRQNAGKKAFNEYAHNTLSTLIGAVIAEQGQHKAVELMVHGFEIAEAYTPEQAA
jgi:hypothetical protein